jgi:hypothetical protein
MIMLSFVAIKTIQAQENHGNTFNLGAGIGGYSGYYGYHNRTLPVLHLNYEIQVAQNFTLAPFATYYSWSDKYYWGNFQRPNRYYNYRQVVLLTGLKGSYYFDEILEAGSKWDFYLAGSLGFAFVKSYWENGYDGDRNYYGNPGNLFFDLHIGTEYHINNRVGLFLDLSNGVSLIGLSIHSKS